jgi:hypothetical protein
VNPPLSLLRPVKAVRQVLSICRKSPIYSFLCLVTIFFWVEGARQIAYLLILSSEPTSDPVPEGTSLGFDLEMTKPIAQNLLKHAWADPTALFIILNLFTAVMILILTLFIYLALSHRAEDSTFSKKAGKLIGAVIEPLLMGAKPHYPWTIVGRATRRTYARLGLFLLQVLTVGLLLHQSAEFLSLVSERSSNASDNPDLPQVKTALAQAAATVSPEMALLSAAGIIGISILVLLGGWYGLMNPIGENHTFDKHLKPTGKMVHILKASGAIFILMAFAGILYFFVSVNASVDQEDESSAPNMLLLNLILFVFTPALGWSLSTIWEMFKGMTSCMRNE